VKKSRTWQTKQLQKGGHPVAQLTIPRFARETRSPTWATRPISMVLFGKDESGRAALERGQSGHIRRQNYVSECGNPVVGCNFRDKPVGGCDDHSILLYNPLDFVDNTAYAALVRRQPALLATQGTASPWGLQVRHCFAPFSAELFPAALGGGRGGQNKTKNSRKNKKKPKKQQPPPTPPHPPPPRPPQHTEQDVDRRNASASDSVPAHHDAANLPLAPTVTPF